MSEKNKNKKKKLTIIIVAAVFGFLALDTLIALYVASSVERTDDERDGRDEPTSRRALPPDAQTVETYRVQRGPQRGIVVRIGEVVAPAEVPLLATRSGEVASVHPELKLGGRIPAGDVMLDYEVDAAMARRDIRRAELVEARVLAEDTRGRFGSVKKLEGIIRSDEIQAARSELEVARARVASAKGSLAVAGLEVGQGQPKARVDMLVLEANVQPGQWISVGQQLARLGVADRVHIRTSVPRDVLPFLPVGTRGEVRGTRGDGHIAEVVALGHEVSVGGLLVQVELALVGAEGDTRWLIGEAVEVELPGPAFDDAARIPTDALQQPDGVYLLASGGSLEPRSVNVVWRDADVVIVDGGLAAGDEVIVTPLELVYPGRLLQGTAAAS